MRLNDLTHALVTLDGAPARIRRCRDGSPFVFISRRDGRGGEVEFSEATARRIVANSGNFRSY